MALKLKRAFHISSQGEEAQELNQLSTDIAVSLMLINTSKKELALGMNRRNEILRTLLLEDCNYIITPTDKVLFLEQTSEIRVYDSNGTTQAEISHLED